MPSRKRLESGGGGHDDERRRAHHIADEHPHAPKKNQCEAARGTQSKNFAQDERDHDSGLESFHSAARFVDPHESIVQLDDVARLERADPNPSCDLHRSVRDGARHILDDKIFELNRPWHRHQRKADRESEM